MIYIIYLLGFLSSVILGSIIGFQAAIKVKIGNEFDSAVEVVKAVKNYYEEELQKHKNEPYTLVTLQTTEDKKFGVKMSRDLALLMLSPKFIEFVQNTVREKEGFTQDPS